MIYAIIKKKDLYHIFNGKKYFDLDDLSFLKIEDVVVTYDQGFKIKNQIHDIAMVETMIYFPGVKSLKTMSLKRFSSWTDITTVKQELALVMKIYKSQVKEMEKINLVTAVNFENSLKSTFEAINNQHIKINVELIPSSKTFQVPTKSELIKYIDKKRYDLYDITKGSYDLSHKTLLSLDDDFLNKYVEMSVHNSKILNLNQYRRLELPVNHIQVGTVNARVTTHSPNLQGMPLEYIEGNIYSFDFNAYEIIIFLSIYNKRLLYDFEDSQTSCAYSFMYNKYIHKIDIDNFKRDFPEKRKAFKALVIEIIYGMTKSEAVYKYGHKVEKVYDVLFDALNLKRIKSVLSLYAQDTGRYLVLEGDFNYSVSDKDSFFFHTLYPEYERIKEDVGLKHAKDQNVFSDNPIFETETTGFYDFYVKENGLLSMYFNHKKNVARKALNYRIAGIGAIIIKTIARKSLVLKSNLLILRHDEVVFDIKDDEDIKSIKKIMKNIFMKYTNAYITVNHKKVSNE